MFEYYFIKGFIFAIILMVISAIIIVKYKDKLDIEADEEEMKELIAIVMAIIAVVTFLGWPLIMPLWILAIIILIFVANYKEKSE